jgi:signal transduction histidine kinase
MISSIIKNISQGALVMVGNTKVLLVGILVLVFPIVFFYITQSFLDTATDNINTVQKQRVELLHQSVATMLEGVKSTDKSTVQIYIDNVSNESIDVKNVSVLLKSSEGYFVTHSSNPDLLGTKILKIEPYEKLPITENESLIVNSLTDSGRVWESYRMVLVEGNEYYVYTQQDFSTLDQVLYSRVQQSYLGLTLIFIFLISLAYWLNRQTFWKGEHEKRIAELKERDIFSNMIAHEFRTPLTVIKGYASFLKESDAVQGENRRFVANISQSTERLIYLVNDFLEVARLQSGKITIKKESINVSEIIEKVVSDLTPIARDKDLKLVTRVSDAINFVTDEARLQQILINLVTNSIKYTKTGSVAISVEKKTDELFIIIEDTGVGISGQDQKKLFQPFSRVGRADESTVIGTGLGMWITNQLVDLLGGEVNLESIEGIGTRVTLSLKPD